MTPRGRYLAVLDGGQPDNLPRIPILMQFAAEHIGSHYGAFASDYRVLVEANLRCAEDFGLDQLSAISDPYRETAGFGAPVIR
jgi:uroporphyrinogen decarboxylase